MIVYPRPRRIGSVDYLKACAQGNNAPKAAHLRSLRMQILEAYGHYEMYVSNPTSATAIVLSLAEVQALHRAYADTYVGKRLEHLRDDLLMAAREIDGDCPICQSNGIEQLDHFLPKSRFPEYSIMALNLVPVCGYCNQHKGDDLDLETGASYFHHYLDELPSQAILIGTPVLRPGRAKSIVFSLAPPTDAEGVGAARYRYQFVKLDLAKRLLARATKDMNQVNAQNARVAASGGALGVREEMLNRAVDNCRRFGVNHWLTAMYTGLANSSEYCNSFEAP